MPEHGSLKTVLEEVTLHDVMPRQAVDTTLMEVAALQLPVANEPQLPDGVP